MRSFIAVTLYAAIYICYFIGIEPLASLPREHMLWISVVFAAHVLAEVSYLRQRAFGAAVDVASKPQPPQAIEAPKREPVVPSSVL